MLAWIKAATGLEVAGGLLVTGIIGPSGKLYRVGGVLGKMLFAVYARKVLVIPMENWGEAQALIARDDRLRKVALIPADNAFELAAIAHNPGGIRSCK